MVVANLDDADAARETSCSSAADVFVVGAAANSVVDSDGSDDDFLIEVDAADANELPVLVSTVAVAATVGAIHFESLSAVGIVVGDGWAAAVGDVVVIGAVAVFSVFLMLVWVIVGGEAAALVFCAEG